MMMTASEVVVEAEKQLVMKLKDVDINIDIDSDDKTTTTTNSNSKVVVEIKSIKHYSSRDKILLVGEGDFSFAACLAKAFGHASNNMVATSLDSQEMLFKQYSNAEKNLEVLKEKGCTVMHEVDARTMSSHPKLKHKLFDRIVFNFPHTKLFYHEHDSFQIELHQDLVRDFFKSAYKLLEEGGEIHVTHKTAHPFDRWDIEELAAKAGLCLVKKVPFYLWEYPGYSNKKGEGHCIGTVSS